MDATLAQLLNHIIEVELEKVQLQQQIEQLQQQIQEKETPKRQEKV